MYNAQSLFCYAEQIYPLRRKKDCPFFSVETYTANNLNMNFRFQKWFSLIDDRKK